MEESPQRAAAKLTTHHSRIAVWVTAILGIVILASLFVFSDGRKLLETVSAIPAPALAGPLLLGVLSYLVMARSYQGIAGAAGWHLPFPVWVRITFVSNTVNYLVTSAGLSGFAARMFLLAQQGVPSSQAVIISLVKTFLTNVTLLVFIIAGFVSLVMRGRLDTWALVVVGTMLAAFSSLLVAALVLARRPTLRRRTLVNATVGLHRRVHYWLPRWTFRRARLWRFQRTVDRGLDFVLARKRLMLLPTAWIIADWFVTIAILWAAFQAVQHPLPVGIVMIGFGVGLLASLVSIVPGGLGIMEGSMAAVFASLGVPLEPAVVAVLLFRISYFLLPMVVSLFLFHGLVRQATLGATGEGAVGADG
jgi:glycosyltransferase 2 family protein